MTHIITHLIFGVLLIALSSATLSANPLPNRLNDRGVRSECGLQPLEATGKISFSDSYDGNPARFELRVSDEYKRVELKLDAIEIGDLNLEKVLHLVRLQVDTPDRHEGTANYWRRGIELNTSDLDENREIEMKVRIDLPASRVTAGYHEIRMKWLVHCE